MENKIYKSFLKNYYLTTALYDFVFAYAVYNVLFNIKGLSIFQISALLAWWSLTTIILEIPSGALADYWSRRQMMIISPLIKSLCFITWFFAQGDFYLYALGFLFWTIGSVMRSGTQEAILYDKLIHLNKTTDHEKILGRKHLYYQVALGISTISGGFIAHYSLDLVLLVSVFPLLFSAYFATKIKEAPKVKSTGEVKYLEYIKHAYIEFKNNPTLKHLFIYSLAISVFWDLEEFDQLYYRLVNLPIWAFGIAGLSGSALNSLGSFYAHKFKNKIWIFYIPILLSSGLLFLVGYMPNIYMIIILILACAIATPTKVLLQGRLQKQIKSLSRATTTSVESLLTNFFGIIIVLFFGYISKLQGLPSIYIFSSIFLVITAIWTIKNRKLFN